MKNSPHAKTTKPAKTTKSSSIKNFCIKHQIALLLIFALVVQTIVYVKVGIDKSYIHMDEGYSLGLASYDKTEIQDSADFYDTWHNGAYYEDYLALGDDEMSDFSPVYENQKNDVHPPLYYLLLRIAMIFSPNHFSKWGGIIINIIIYAFITIFAYLILNKLYGNKPEHKVKAVMIAFISSITLASLTNVIYIRMYALAALNIMIITFLHMKLYEKYSYKILAWIGLAALVGSLTHYFYLFYLAMLCAITVVHFIKHKEPKRIIGYAAALAIAAVCSLVIFPYSIQHMLFSNRGTGVISNLTSPDGLANIVPSIGAYLFILQRYAFNGLLAVLAVAIVALYAYRKVAKTSAKPKYSPYFILIWLPVLFYALLVAVSSPWKELRYVAPVCSLIFITMYYWLEQLLASVISKTHTTIIIYALMTLTAITPFFTGVEPQVAYTDKRDIVAQVQGELNVPTVFWFNSGENRFLDDILLFSLLDESYVAKDVAPTASNVNHILAGRDLSDGILVFINGGQDNDTVIDAILDATPLDTVSHIKRMNACDIYYIK